MAKEPPILVVNKTDRPTAASRRKRTASAGSAPRKSRKPSGKKKRKGERRLPGWLLWILGGLSAIVFLSAFYYFFIRPYAYRWKPCSGLKAYGVCLPYGFKVHGFDISHHQGKINWDELSKAQYTPFPVRFVFMKASEGGDFSDTTFIHSICCMRDLSVFSGKGWKAQNWRSVLYGCVVFCTICFVSNAGNI